MGKFVKGAWVEDEPIWIPYKSHNIEFDDIINRLQIHYGVKISVVKDKEMECLNLVIIDVRYLHKSYITLEAIEFGFLEDYEIVENLVEQFIRETRNNNIKH